MPQILVPAATFLQNVVPPSTLELPDLSVLGSVWIDPPVFATEPSVSMDAALLIEDAELVFGIPGLDALQLVIGSTGNDTWFRTRFTTAPEPLLSLTELPLTLRLKNDLVRPAREVPGSGAGAPKRFEVDPTRVALDIVLAEVAVVLDLDGGITVQAGSSIDLPPCMIGDSGMVIEARGITLHLDPSAPPPHGQRQGWKGIHLAEATLSLPGDLGGTVGTLSLTDAYLGNGGFTGKVRHIWTPARPARLFGMDLTLASVEIAFVQNAPTACALHGTLMLPFFDQPVGVDLSVGLNGSISVAVSAIQPDGVASAGGLLTFRNEGVLEAQVSSLGFTLADGTFSVTLTGSIRPLVPGVHWPWFEVQALTIDSDGNVHLNGGWLDLPQQYSLDFFDFRIDVTRIGFGHNPDGGRWIGFSGGITLVSGMTAGASVDGLRVTWQPGGGVKMTLDGVGVELEIPGTLRFRGSVAYHEIGGVHRFDGAVTIELLALDLRVDGQIVIGSDTDAGGETYTFLALYLGVELPAGIPLWSTGLALYGVDGLVALDMAPNKGAAPNALHPASRPGEEWYENRDGSPGWFKRAPVGITDLRSKWDPKHGAFALGGGVTLGTVADNGYTFSSKVLLVVSLPGPVILLEGKANLLKERTKLSDDPIFRALAVLDFRAGTFLVGLDAKYKVPDKVPGGGEILDIGGSAEFYFAMADASAWHLYLGEKDPTERRIRARMLSLFEANSYFMIDATQLQTGAWIGYDASWSFGPLSVVVQAWMDGGVAVSWKPVHFHGQLWLHGSAELRVFGFGLGLHVDARLDVDVVDPFHLLGDFSVGISLPWPLPDFGVDITLEWGPEPTRPPLPLPLKEIAVEHFKSSASWPLPRGRLLQPNLEAGGGMATLPPPPADLGAPAPVDAPVVPMDARPHLTFGRSVHDDAHVGVNGQPVLPDAKPDTGWERIGDPAAQTGPMRVRYSLQEIALDRWTGGAWEQVARTGATKTPGIPEIYGSWAPVPALAGGPIAPGGVPAVDQTKLWLWSRTPFDYTRHGGSAWDEWFTDAHPGYPCLPALADIQFCVGFTDRRVGQTLGVPVVFAGFRELILEGSPPLTVEPLTIPVAGRDRALSWQRGREPLTLTLVGAPAREVRLWVTGPGAAHVLAAGVDDDGNPHGPYGVVSSVITVPVDRLRQVVVQAPQSEGEEAAPPVALAQICVTIPPSTDDVTTHTDMAAHLIDSAARFADEGAVLAPGSTYRLRVATRLQAVGEGDLKAVSETHDLTELAYFRTDGPPALAALATPIGQEPARFRSGLTDLTRYVDHTVPASGGRRLQPTRPAFRGYDVGVIFNEAYVDLMYRLARRDLALYLYDANSRLVRDPLGRVVVAGNRWGHRESLQVSDSERRYLTVIDGGSCVTVDERVIPRHVTLAAGGEAQVLAADAVYEARLQPLLLHEDFSAGLGRWTRVDSGTEEGPAAWATIGHATLAGSAATVAAGVVTLTGAGDLTALDPAVDAVKLATDIGRPSRTYRIVAVDNATKQVTVDGFPSLVGGTSSWEVPGFGRLIQTANIHGGSDDGDDPVKPGTTLVTGDKSWTDYRFAVQLRSGDEDGIGVAFRWNGPGDHYRFSMDATRGYRRLVRIAAGVHTVLGEDDVTYRTNQDYAVTVEAVGAELAVYVDGNPVFRVTDATFTSGGVGLYCWANLAARFTDVRVDDLAPGAPVAHRFSFTTSRYVTFAHLFAGADGRTWPLTGPWVAVSTALTAAVSLGTIPDSAEQRAYDALAAAVLGPLVTSPVTRVEAAVVRADDIPRTLLIRSPEPIDWSRTTLAVARADAGPAPGDIPRAVAITDLAVGGPIANEEVVSLVLRDTGSVAGAAVQHFGFPGGLLASDDRTIFSDGFAGADHGVLLDEHFGSGALGRFARVDSGTIEGPGKWSVSGGELHQTSNIWGGVSDGSDPNKPGTVAVTGGLWADVTVGVTLRALDDDAVGLIVRWSGPGDFYLFVMNRQYGYRQFVRWAGGTATTLWEDTVRYDMGRTYRMEVTAFGDTFVGRLDGEPLFLLHDYVHGAGRVGMYCWAYADAHFSALRVDACDTSPVLWAPALTDLTEFTVVDETVDGGPSAWNVDAGELLQTSRVGSAAVAIAGTSAVSRRRFGDYHVQAEVSAHDGAYGLVFGYLDPADWFRLEANSVTGHRRLLRSAAGILTTLWEDATASFSPDNPLILTAEMTGGRLHCWIGGVAVADLPGSRTSDPAGSVGIWCWQAPALHVSRLRVFDATVRVGDWVVRDEAGAAGGRSAWSIASGVLRQTAPAGSPDLPAALGTVAIPPVAVPQQNLRDYRAGVAVSAHDGAVGLQFRRADEDNYYRLSLAPGYRRLVTVVAGFATTLWEDTGGYAADSPASLTVDAIGDRIVGYSGDLRLFDLHDAGHAEGGVALYAARASRVRFTGFRITTPPSAARALWLDRFAAGDTSGWSFVDETTLGGPAVWAVSGGALQQTSGAYTEPTEAAAPDKPGTSAVVGDPAWQDVVLKVRLRSDKDGAIGVLCRYVDKDNWCRFSMDAGRPYRRLVRMFAGTVTVLWEDATTYEVGREYEVVVTAVGSRLRCWLDGVPVFDVSDAELPAGRVGVYCWGNKGARFLSVQVHPVSATTSDWLFADDFTGVATTRWAFSEAHGPGGGPGTWEFTGGELRQTSAAGAGPDSDAALPGTVALVGDATWTDYRLTVALTSSTGGALGVLFRCTDADNWYRFALDPTLGYRRLTRSVSGVVTELWADARPGTGGRMALFTVDAVGDSLVGYLDGVQLFEVRDAAHPTGRIGLYTRFNPGARFGSVHVSAPRWMTHYRFAPDEPAMSAGTEVRIRSGNASDWTGARRAGVEERFTAGPGDPGSHRFAATRALFLRVLEPTGEPGHRRRFLPPAAFAPLTDARVLRRADGTGLAVTIAGGALPAGTYRLIFTYRRDNSAVALGSDVLSRAGETSDERVVLDIDT